MTSRFGIRLSGVATVLLVVVFLAPARVSAHCDGLDGPVVNAARKALDAGNVSLALVWVPEHDEAEIIAAFARTRAVRTLSPEAQRLADTYFFETLVRVHRAAEGAPYTGLKPAGRDLGPAVPAADKAVETGSLAALGTLLMSAMQAGLAEQFEAVVRAKAAAQAGDVAAGRKYVQAYVPFVHYVERLYEAASQAAHGHAPDERAASNHR